MSIDVQTATPGTFRHVVKIDAHTLQADMPKAEGGDDTGPGAHDYFDASLGVCKAMTAVWYAKKNGIPLDRVEVHLDRDASQERQGTYVLKVAIAFFGGLDPAQKQKLYDVVSRCPVHKLMTTTKVQVETAPLPA
jgi:putative redox protein